MKYLEFTVAGTAVSRNASDKTVLVSGASGYFGLHFEFDEEWQAIPGIKAVDFFKNKNRKRVDLVDNACAIPDEMMTDKDSIQFRVIVGSTLPTAWITIPITESGTIVPDEPDEEAPAGMEYVKTMTGDAAVPMLRKGDSGLEFSQNGEDWEGGISGIPDAPATPKDTTYVRKHGDWVPYEAATPTDVEGLTGTATSLATLLDDADLSTAVAKINEIIGILIDRGISTS